VSSSRPPMAGGRGHQRPSNRARRPRDTSAVAVSARSASAR
jgi:hypothetical protein